MYVVKLRVLGGNLVCTIPRALARELQWTARVLVGVARANGNDLTVTNLERHLATTKHLRNHPAPPDTRTESPTTREHRARAPR